MELVTREEILTKFDESWFHNHSLFGLKEILNIAENAQIYGGTFLTRKKQKNVKKSIQSILRNVNRNKSVSTKDLKVVFDFAEWCDNYLLDMGVLPDASNHCTQQQIDSITEKIDGLLLNVFQVRLYLSAKLSPNVAAYYLNDTTTIEPVVSNSTVSIHV
jgi:hypothetical protein